MSKKLTVLAIFGLALIFTACGNNNSNGKRSGRTQVNERMRRMAGRERAQQMGDRQQQGPGQIDPGNIVAKVDTPADDSSDNKREQKKELTEVEKDCLAAIKNIAANINKVVYKVGDELEQEFLKAAVDEEPIQLKLSGDEKNPNSDLTFNLDSEASRSYKCVLAADYKFKDKDTDETIEMATDKPAKYDDDAVSISLKGKRQTDDKTPVDVVFEFRK